MRKILSAILLMISMTVNAAIFDGVDLNANKLQVLRDISSKGYVFNEELNCLEGDCQGTMIRIRFNLEDTSNRNKIGQLIIDVPNGNFENSVKLFNVVYHQTKSDDSSYTYRVDADGTTMILEKIDKGIRLTYCTPYYEKK